MELPQEYYDFCKQFKTGVKFRINRWNVQNGERLLYVLDNYDGDHIAIKFFGKHKQYWHYDFMDGYLLWECDKNGWLEFVK
jgi:hypothetical protein